MHELLRLNVAKRVPLTDREWAAWERFFVPKSVRKRQFLLQGGDVCRQIYFVNEGCLRSYTVDPRGEEHVIQFAIRDWWITDMHSFLAGTPSTYTIDALHDTDLLVLDKSARDALLETAPKADRFFRLLQEANYVATHQRVEALLQSSAEERYLEFVKTYPALVEEIPQNQIATYLGITPQSLSRIRKDLSKKA